MAKIINGGWFKDLLRAAQSGLPGSALHLTGLGDSTWTSSGNASIVPYLLGFASQLDIVCNGFPCHDAQVAPFTATGMNHSIVTSDATVNYFAPGAAATAEGNSDGAHVGMLWKFDYTANRFTGGLSRLYSLATDAWFRSGFGPLRGSDTTARMLILRTPTGPTAMQFVGKRNGSVVGTTAVDASSPNTGGVDEYVDKVDVSCGSGTSSIAMEMQGGANDETGKSLQMMNAMFLGELASPRGLYLDTMSIGGWTSLAWASASGDPTISGGYTGRVTDLAWESWWTATKITGTKRVLVILLGQNDGGVAQNTRRTYLQNIVSRAKARATAAGDTLSGIVIFGAPDPGNGGTNARFDSYDDDAEWLVTDSGTVDCPIMAVRSRELLAGSGSIVGEFGIAGLASANGGEVHPSAIGCNGYMGRFASALEQVGVTGRVMRVQQRTLTRGPHEPI